MSFFTSPRNPLGDKMNLGQITKDGKREWRKKKKKPTERDSQRAEREREREREREEDRWCGGGGREQKEDWRGVGAWVRPEREAN